MTSANWIELLALIVALAVTSPILGGYLARIYDPTLGKPLGDRVFSAIERPIFRICGIDPEGEQRWTTYAYSLLAFSLVSVLVLYAQLRLQGRLPLNPDHYKAISPGLAFNTAVSFLTNTNWQAYGDGVMSYFSQMTGLAFHNFVSAAAGAAVAVALIRGLTRRRSRTLGNFWVDMIRTCLRVLLPIAFVSALIMVSQGTPDNFHATTQVTTLAGATQSIPGGPVASQEAIKMAGQNGGGFFATNSADPFENPNPITNFLQLLSIFLIPAGLTVTLGQMTGSPKHGWAVFSAMSVLWLAGVFTCYWAEAQPSTLLHGVNQQHIVGQQPGGNMEGKEVRFGIANSALFATVTTDASCGAVNAMHDSFTPLGGLVPMANILLGEIVFGGVGAGMYGMLIFVILSVFIAGLMVGRTPEYLGKKIESYDIQMAMLYLLIFPLIILGFSAVAILSPTYGLSALTNHGPHGLSEILYAYTSATGNNGSAFAGLSSNTDYWNLTLGIAMFSGRFLMLIPMLAIAGNLVQKKSVPATSGTFPVTTPLFTTLLTGVILIVGALTFFPALALGPILEHLLLRAGNTF